MSIDKTECLKTVTELFEDENLWDGENTDEEICRRIEEIVTMYNIPVALLYDINGNSALHQAAQWNRIIVIEKMLLKGVEVNDANKNGNTALDLAMHWGHADVSAQLRHYGGKHSCEQERDFAIAQHNVTMKHLCECEAEMENALNRARAAVNDKEVMQIEYDRLLVMKDQACQQSDIAEEENIELKAEIDKLMMERQKVQLDVAQLRMELQDAINERRNAVQSWKLAQEIMKELEAAQFQSRVKEEEALRMRNEAIHDRDIAIALAKTAQRDQGLAKQSQLIAEQEKQEAEKKLLDATTGFAIEQSVWTKKVAETEIERRNIATEIEYQKRKLMKANKILTRQIALLTQANVTADKHLNQLTSQMETVQTELHHKTQALEELRKESEAKNVQLKVLKSTRKEDITQWKTQFMQKSYDEMIPRVTCIMEQIVFLWQTVIQSHREFDDLFSPSTLHLEKEKSMQYSEDTIDLERKKDRVDKPTTNFCQVSPHRQLPKLETNAESLQNSESEAHIERYRKKLDKSSPKQKMSLEDKLNISHSQCHWFSSSIKFPQYLSSAQKLLHTTKLVNLVKNDGTMHLDSVQNEVKNACSVVRDFLIASSEKCKAYHLHRQKQIESYEKMIQRKEEIIARFTHHQYEKWSKFTSTGFRDCSIQSAAFD